MRPLGYDQPETLTQGYDPPVDSVAINAAPRRRVVAPAKYTSQQTNGPKNDFVAGVSGTTMGGRDGLFSLALTYFLVLLPLYLQQAFSHPGDALLASPVLCSNITINTSINEHAVLSITSSTTKESKKAKAPGRW